MNHLEDRITKLEDRALAIESSQKEILDLLRPIAETYTTATTLGKWGMGFLVFISVGLGIILAVKQLQK